MIQARRNVSRHSSKQYSSKSGKKLLTGNKSKLLAWDSRISAPAIKIDLLLECRRVPKKDSFTQADVFCVVWELPAGYRPDSKKVARLPSRREREIGRTEVVRGEKNPRFPTSFRLEYRFQEEQLYIVRSYDEDLKYSTDLKEHNFLGGAIFSLGELLGAAGSAIAYPLNRGKAFIVLMGQEITESREVLEFRFSGQDLGELELKNAKAKVAKEVFDTVQKVNVVNHVLDIFDGYFQIETLNPEDQSWNVVWRSEVIKDNPNPTWNTARLPLPLLCGDDPTRPMKISIWDWNRFIPDSCAGSVEISVSELVQQKSRGIPVLDIMIEKKKLLGGKKLKRNGMLKVLKSSIVNIPSMMQYISGGCELDLVFAIDCTTMNKHWTDKESLHYNTTAWMNDYQAALHKIATIYSAFDGTKDFTMWGYGGKLEGNHQSCFPLAERIPSADGLLAAYDKIFAPDNTKLELGSKAQLKHAIQNAMYRAIESSKRKQSYTTLVLLTTGAITDLQNSMDAICSAAEDAPLSIVVIGVGSGDFRGVSLLKGTETRKLAHSNGVPITRNIVNFASFSDFNHDTDLCISEALGDIQEQFVQYYLNAGLKPMPPKPVRDFTRENIAGTRVAETKPRKDKGDSKNRDSRRSRKSKR